LAGPSGSYLRLLAFMLACWLTWGYYTIKQVKFQDNSLKMSVSRNSYCLSTALRTG